MSVSLMVLVVLMVILLCLSAKRRGRKREPDPRQGGVVMTPSPPPPEGLDVNEPESVQESTRLTENPAYDSTHSGLVASVNWLPRQSQFQLWKAQYYETPIISSRVGPRRGQRLEQSYHHYDTPTGFVHSSHHYEQI